MSCSVNLNIELNVTLRVILTIIHVCLMDELVIIGVVPHVALGEKLKCLGKDVDNLSLFLDCRIAYHFVKF